MAAADSITPDPSRISARLPQPLSLGMFAVILFLTTVVATIADDQRGTPKPQSFPKDATFLHPVCKNGKWGYIGGSGKTVIEPQFDYAGDFSEALAPARKGEIAGYLRTDGMWQIRLPEHVSPTRSFREGRVAFLDGNKFGFLDRDGNIAVPPAYDQVTDFRDGRAGVLTGYGRLVGG